MITIKNYVRAGSLEEAYTLNQKKQNKVLGGMLFIRLGHGSVDTAIDLSGLGLSGIEETEDRFIIGAMTTLRELELHPGLEAYSDGAVRNALEDIVGVQFRNLATVGGSLFGRFGFSDVLTVLTAMDTEVVLYKGGIVPLREFAYRKADRDILVRVIIKKTPGHFSYQAVRLQRTDIPVLNAVSAYVGHEFRTVIGARPMRAMLVPDENKLLENGLNEDSVRAFSEYAASVVPTQANGRGSAEYRTHLVRVLTARNLEKLGGML